MDHDHAVEAKNGESVQEILAGAGYSDKAIDYYLQQPNMGMLADADQISELTGTCGDTMKVYLKLQDGCIEDARFQVLGCPGAIAAAMAYVDIVRGMTLENARKVKDGDVFRALGQIPDQKQHCIRLAVKTLNKAIEAYCENTQHS